MKFEKKLLIGALGLVLGVGSCEYALYKKFEHHPNTVREMVRWPYNRMYTECDQLTEEYKQLRDLTLQSITGRIRDLGGLQGYITPGPARYGRYSIRRDSINFIELEDGRRFAYIGDFFAGKNDKVNLEMLANQQLTKIYLFLEKLKRFRKKYPGILWVTSEYDSVLKNKRNIQEAFINIPLTKLRHLDGIIENYDIIEDN